MAIMALKLIRKLFDGPVPSVGWLVHAVAIRPSFRNFMVCIILYVTYSLRVSNMKAEGALNESAIPAVAKALEVTNLTFLIYFLFLST